MKEGGFILKHRIHEVIKGRRIKAALFYTFNFDPKFFENYVMPLLVPDQTFTDNAIANNLIWRRLYKDHLVPPITVYYDEDVKSIEQAPLLDYNLVGINMPMIGKNKGNFHPKQIFILLENPDNTAELLVVTGSNNLTFSGWCENVECLSEQQLINAKFFPKEFRKEVKEFIESVFQHLGKEKSIAEEMILDYLSKIKFTKSQELYLYTSFQGPFLKFLEDNVLSDDSIKDLEIISPYFSPNPEILQFCQDHAISVKIQAPIKDNYCIMDKQHYQSYSDSGVKWYVPDEVERTNHSKVYRFYGLKKVYSIVGSVNLTKPAWRGFDKKSKEICNIESAVMYIEEHTSPSFLLTKEIKSAAIKFIEPGLTEETWHERREIPDIQFTINWLDKILSWKGKLKNRYEVHISASHIFSLNDQTNVRLGDLENSDTVLRSLSRKPLIAVTEQNANTSEPYYFYLHQEFFELRPLEFRLSATDILEAWDLLGTEDSVLKDWLITRLEFVTHAQQDESGKLISDRTINKSLLNEMSRHFYGLVKLEEFLFNDHAIKKSRASQFAHLNNLKYYLTNDNVDTLYSYIKDIRKLYESEEIMSVFYWLILNIILHNFYQNKDLNMMLKMLYADHHNINEIKKALLLVTDELLSEIASIEYSLDLDQQQLHWGLSILKSNYAIPG